MTDTTITQSAAPTLSKLFDMPLGARFRYAGREKVYVLLGHADSGLVGDAVDVLPRRQFQGVYSAAESRAEFEAMLVEPVPFAALSTTPQAPAEGYVAAFYELAKLMGIPAQSVSPEIVWREQMLPRLRSALAKPLASAEPIGFICPNALRHMDEGRHRAISLSIEPEGNDDVPVFLATPQAPAEPVAWVRCHPDGTLTGEVLMDGQIEQVRKASGGWLPLALATPPAQEVQASQAVPSEPTAKMCKAAADAWLDAKGALTLNRARAAIKAAMAAAPPAAQPVAQEVTK